MTSQQFDVETMERLSRIRSNPNPYRQSGISRMIAWGKNIDRARAFEASRTTFAILGAAGYAGYLASMHIVLCSLSLIAMGGTWYGVYRIMEGSK